MENSKYLDKDNQLNLQKNHLKNKERETLKNVLLY